MEKHDVLSQCYGHLLPPVDSLSNIHKVTFKDKQIYFLVSRKQKVTRWKQQNNHHKNNLTLQKIIRICHNINKSVAIN